MMEFIKEELDRSSVFLDETKLSTEFIPEHLLHREDEFKQLTHVYLSLIKSERYSSRNTLLTGPNGSGKTALAKRFGLSFERIAHDFERNVKYIHVNCRLLKSNYAIMKRIVDSLGIPFPDKGYSLYEIVTTIKRVLEKRSIHVILTLDEMNFLDLKNDNLLYMLGRINDDEMNASGLISIIGIEKNLTFIKNLDLSTLSSFQYNVVALNPYDTSQIRDILSFRADLSFQPTAVAADIINYIAMVASKTGDMRFSLELLYKAGKHADHERLDKITPECVRHAQAKTFEHFDFNAVYSLAFTEKVLLVATCRALKKNKSTSISIDELRQAYEVACEEMGVEPVRRSQFYVALHHLKHIEIISLFEPKPKKKGQCASVSIDDVPVAMLEQELVKQMWTGDDQHHVEDEME